MERVLVVFFSYTGTSRRLALRPARLQGRSFLMRMAPKLRDIAAPSVQDRGGAAHAVAEVTAITHRALGRAAAFLRQDILDGSYEPRLQAFGQALLRRSPNGGASETSRLSPRTA